MPRPRNSRGGRPSLGPQDTFNVRVPKAIGELIRDLAEERGTSFNAVVSGGVVAHFGPLAGLDQLDTRDEQLPLSA